MQESSIARVTRSAEPLKRIRENAERAEAEKLANDDRQDPVTRLRAYLAIGKVPPRGLVTEENIAGALSVDDRVTFLTKLAVNAKVVKAEIPLRAIVNGLAEIGSRSAVRLSRNLSRIIRKWDASVPVVGVSDDSVSYVVLILERISRFQGPDGRRRSAKKGASDSPYVQLLKIVTKWVTACASPRSLVGLLRILGAAEKQTGATLDELIGSDKEFSNYFEGFLVKCLDECEELVKRGAISEFRELSDAVNGLPAAKSQLRERVAKLYSEKGRFSFAMQDALRMVTGVAAEEPSASAIQVDDQDSVQTVQVASALFAAWAGKQDGSRAKEAYEELKSVAKNFFGLELHGDAGEIEEYNPRVHELILGTKPNTRVRLLGPWVEFSRQTTSKVILKAPVEPA